MTTDYYALSHWEFNRLQRSLRLERNRLIKNFAQVKSPVQKIRYAGLLLGVEQQREVLIRVSEIRDSVMDFYRSKLYTGPQIQHFEFGERDFKEE